MQKVYIHIWHRHAYVHFMHTSTQAKIARSVCKCNKSTKNTKWQKNAKENVTPYKWMCSDIFLNFVSSFSFSRLKIKCQCFNLFLIFCHGKIVEAIAISDFCVFDLLPTLSVIQFILPLAFLSYIGGNIVSESLTCMCALVCFYFVCFVLRFIGIFAFVAFLVRPINDISFICSPFLFICQNTNMFNTYQ